MQLSEYEQNILDKLGKLIHEGKLSNAFMIQNFELMRDHLNLKTIRQLEKETGKSYPGIRDYCKLDKTKVGKTVYFADNK